MIEKNFEGVSVRWVIALKGEAEEIIKNYAMKRLATTPFPVYKNKDFDMTHEILSLQLHSIPHRMVVV